MGNGFLLAQVGASDYPGVRCYYQPGREPRRISGRRAYEPLFPLIVSPKSPLIVSPVEPCNLEGPAFSEPLDSSHPSRWFDTHRVVAEGIGHSETHNPTRRQVVWSHGALKGIPSRRRTLDKQPTASVSQTKVKPGLGPGWVGRVNSIRGRSGGIGRKSGSPRSRLAEPGS